MPVRDKAVTEMVALAIGPHRMPKIAAKLLYIAAEALYVHTLDTIDWNRVMHDAATRHMELHDGSYLTSGLDDEHQEGQVCSECIQEAVLANEWGGVKSWAKHPKALRHRPYFQPLSDAEVGVVIGSLAARFMKPDAAPEEDREDDGHLHDCEEIGRTPNEVMVCDPACPHYENWIEDLA